MKKRRKLGWYLFGVVVISLTLLIASCGGGTTPAGETKVEEEKTVTEEPQQAAPEEKAPEQEAPTAEAPAEEPVAASGPPNIPHTLEGRDDCLMCHATGGLKPFPADHEGRTIDTCRACHQPA